MSGMQDSVRNAEWRLLGKVTMNKLVQIEKYRKKIKEIKNILGKPINKDITIIESENEIRCLEYILKTIDFLSWKRRLRLGEIPNSAIVLEKNLTEFGEKDNYISSQSSEENIRIYPITNYYPWSNIRLTNLYILKNEINAMAIDITFYNEKPRWSMQWDEQKKVIYIIADIIIQTSRDIWCVNECVFWFSVERNKGRSEWIYIKEIPYSLQEIRNIKVLIKEIEINYEEVKNNFNIYAESGMDCLSLKNYRDEIKRKNAVCRQEQFENGWLCVCGLFHELKEKECCRCGDTLKCKEMQ